MTDEVTLLECPPGLFQTLDGHWGFKTEYAHKSEHDGRYYPEAYVVESGEFFWGGVTDHPSRAALMVRPVDVTTLATEAPLRAEIARLRVMVGSAYFEGFSDGPGDEDDAIACWQQSEARAALAQETGDD